MHVADMCGNETAVRQRTDTNGDVDVLVDQVRIAIRQQQADIDRGKGREKFHDRRQHMQPAEYDGRRNNQIADGVDKLPGGRRNTGAPQTTNPRWGLITPRAAARSASPTWSRMLRQAET